MGAKKLTPASACVLIVGAAVYSFAIVGCAAEELQPEEVRSSYDSINLAGKQKAEIGNLSNDLDREVQTGARVDLIVDRNASTEAVAQIVLPGDDVRPTSEDVISVVRGIEQSTVHLNWRVEAVSPQGAHVSLSEAALGAGFSPAMLSPFGDLQVEASVSEDQS